MEDIQNNPAEKKTVEEVVPPVAEEENVVTEPQNQPTDNEDEQGTNSEDEEKKRNAEQARLRREREYQARLEKEVQERLDKEYRTRADKEISETRIKTIIDVVGTNPYTNKPIEDEFDAKVYLEMKKCEKEGLDPVEEESRIYKRISKAETEKRDTELAESKRKANEEAKNRQDIDEFESKYNMNDAQVKALLDDDKFKDYAYGKLGKMPLTKIYEGYQKFYPSPAQEKQQEKRNPDSVGGLGGNPQNEQGYYTMAQIRSMSREEIKKNYDLVSKSQAYWASH